MVLVVEDFLQLKPVNANYCFQPIKADVKKKIFGGTPLNYDLWDEFEYYLSPTPMQTTPYFKKIQNFHAVKIKPKKFC